MNILVTGGNGFIGSNLIRLLLEQTLHSVVNIDRLTYAAAPEALAGYDDPARLVQERIDVCDPVAVRRVFATHRPDAVLHLAAESHVDRSIEAPATFVRTNVLGTHTLLAVTRDYWAGLGPDDRARFRYVHVSTDEVFGSRAGDEAATEATPYCPSSPYAGSKAAADQLAWSYHRTFGLPLVMSHSCNNYGPWQFPEKLIPVTAVRALEGQPIPLYGDGANVRDWLHVSDHARALVRLLEAGAPGTAYAITAGNERTNLDLVREICERVDALQPHPRGRPHFGLVRFVRDRPGHDRRYGLTGERMRSELGWAPRVELQAGLAETVAWYHEHLDWCRERLSAATAGTGSQAG